MPSVKAPVKSESIADLPQREFYKREERTGPQLAGQVGFLSDAVLQTQYEHNSAIYKKMLNDPTIAFARMLTVAPLVMAGWSYEETPDAPEGAKEFIEKQFEPIRVQLVKQAMEGYIDHGWSGHEMVYAPVYKDDTRIGVRKAKELLQEYTHVLVNKATGEWIGFRQSNVWGNNKDIDLSIYDSLLISIDTKGTNWYGRPLLENVRGVYGQWNDSNDAAMRYDTKIAGAHWVVHYPTGDSPFGPDKVETDNYDIAMKVLGQLQASGRIVVPTKLAQFVDEMNLQKVEDAWKIELISDSGAGSAGFVERQKYLDALKVRAFGFPERAILEGQFGTKAEAETHADAAIGVQEMRHLLITQPINKISVDYLLEVNYGQEACGSVHIRPKPLIDRMYTLLKQIYTVIIANPNVLAQEINIIDMPAIRKILGVPELADSAASTKTDKTDQSDPEYMVEEYLRNMIDNANQNQNGNNSNSNNNNKGKQNNNAA